MAGPPAQGLPQGRRPDAGRATLGLGTTPQTPSALERSLRKFSAERRLQLSGLLGLGMALQKKPGARPNPDCRMMDPSYPVRDRYR